MLVNFRVFPQPLHPNGWILLNTLNFAIERFGLMLHIREVPSSNRDQAANYVDSHLSLQKSAGVLS